MLFCLSCMFGIKAQRTVSGVVTSSDDGQPMIGVTVRIEGTTIGTFTDVDGHYVIKNVPETATNVVFSFIGYHMQSLPIAKQVDVVMKPMAEMLQEVVVTAMAVERQKKSLGYAVQEVKAESLTQAAVDNVANALQGKVAGLQITQAGGSLGASQRISIRGNSSLGSNSPLIVIDGIPMDNSSMLVGNHYNSAYDLGTGLGDINPEDIESVSVLKGGSAAIYGMRAGNGVILITTKKGHAGKKHSATITYDGSLTFDRACNLPPFQDKYGVGEYGSEYNYNLLKQSGVFVDPNLTYKQFAEGGWMAYDENGQEVDGSYYGMGFSYEDGYGAGLNDWSIGSWGPRLDIGLKIKQYNSPIVDGVRQPTDWVSHPDNVASFFETGISQSHQFSISNAGEQGSYRASIGYTGQSGILPNTDMDRYNFGLTGKYKFNTKWWLDASTHFTRTESKNRTNVGYSDFNPLMTFTQWFGRQVDMADLKAHYEEKMPDGTYYNWTPGFVNPYFASYNNTNPYYRNRLISKASLWFQPNQYLKFEGRAGYDISHRMFEERIAYTAPGFNGSYTQFDVFDENLILDAIAYYDRTWNKLTLNALAGANDTNEVYRSSSIGSSTANGLTIPGLFSVSNIAGKPVVAADHSHIRSNSLYANAVLGWNNQYYLEGSVREDWHSTIAP
ncbi:MAG: SusC/RagA family TonB-linked outer membrane protein, partial [Bacteroidales bacterium]|nr:SusC/RagA family TonB-linked outer membrane protein [Candidatus Colimorpha onthohippi]